MTQEFNLLEFLNVKVAEPKPKLTPTTPKSQQSVRVVHPSSPSPRPQSASTTENESNLQRHQSSSSPSINNASSYQQKRNTTSTSLKCTVDNQFDVDARSVASTSSMGSFGSAAGRSQSAPRGRRASVLSASTDSLASTNFDRKQNNRSTFDMYETTYSSSFGSPTSPRYFLQQQEQQQQRDAFNSSDMNLSNINDTAYSDASSVSSFSSAYLGGSPDISPSSPSPRQREEGRASRTPSLLIEAVPGSSLRALSPTSISSFNARLNRMSPIRQELRSVRTPDSPHTVAVTEYKVPNPEGGFVIYEVHDVDIPSNMAVNREMIEEKLEAEKEEKQSARQFERALTEKYTQFLNEQKALRQKIRLEDQKNFNAWQEEKSKREAEEHQRRAAENEDIRKKLESDIRATIAKVREMELNRRKSLEQYSTDLRKQLQEHEEKKKLEAQEQKQPQQLTGYPMRHEEYDKKRDLQRRKDLLEYWKKQLDERKRDLLMAREKDKYDFNRYEEVLSAQERAYAAELANEQQAQRQRAFNEWQQHVLEAELKRQQQKQEKEHEKQLAIQKEKEQSQEQQQARIHQKIRKQQRVKEIQAQMQQNNQKRLEEKLREENYDQKQLNKLNNETTRKILFRCAKTKKILPPSEFGVKVVNQ